jgi:hypothetical protein
MTTTTTVAQKAARRKLNLLELAGELENVSKACKIMGYSRQQFYEIRRNFQIYGSEGLLDKLPERPAPTPIGYRRRSKRQFLSIRWSIRRMAL